MKILIFCPYYPPHVGGLETHADEFNQHLSVKGIEITVFAPRLPVHAPERELKYSKVTVIRFPAFEIIKNYPLPKFWQSKFWRLCQELLKDKFDVVISRTRFFNTSILAALYAKIKKVKWIHIEHGSGFVALSNPFKTELSKLYDYTLGKLIFTKSDLNISISQAVQNFVKKFDQRKSPIIYRGINFREIDKIAPDSELKYRFQNKLIIAWAGRLYKWKGVKDSIKAVLDLPENIKEKITFLVVGDGEDYRQLKKLAQEPVFMLGSKTRQETISILKIADVYIHSSYPGGGLSTSLLEAMYCGCAIIATPHEGANEVISQKNGILCNHQGLSSSIINLIGSGKIKEFGRQARLFTINQFNWNVAIEHYLKYLK